MAAAAAEEEKKEGEPGKKAASNVASNTKFMVSSKYRILDAIGHGAYGVVASGSNLETGEMCAIKKISNVLNNAIEAKRALREVSLLRVLRHENVISLMDLMVSEDVQTDLYLVSELMDRDLHQIIVSQQPLSSEHIQYFVYQILRGLLFIHSANVIHRDLKPSNILVNSNCDIKICDFGLARPVNGTSKARKPEDERSEFMTEYVATRWYRAPEIMLSWSHYGCEIDVWAVGCILAELLGRLPLFPGRDYLDQLHRTLKVTGKPSEEDIDHITSDKARQWVRNFPDVRRADFSRLYPRCKSPECLALLDRCLVFSPERRISVNDALRHPFLRPFHDPSDEPLSDYQFDLSFERQFERLNAAQMQLILKRELAWFTEFQKQRTAYLKRQKK